MFRSKRKSQYTIRDVPQATDHRLRETAALEDISLNQATLRAIQRGLGTGEQPLKYRSVRDLLPSATAVDTSGWATVLSEMDRVNPEEWK
ncbi:MAG: hypothetical protein EBT68_04890 [Verrucomicrobia bacterium]|nr:hypothetical protein [Verrucomicrobiota bacterium]NBR63823.1 hypothetical protein [Verrucomicrobiota bacterium]